MNEKPFAFISYCRLDKSIAQNILDKVTSYVYPSEWVDAINKPADDKYVRPVYMDIANLSVSEHEYQKELDENVIAARYLIVLCTKNSAQSDPVKHEIDLFLESHNNDSSLILPVFLGDVFKGMHYVVDEIISKRNCPIYVEGKGMAGRLERQYCLYHILEFLLKVEFSRLFNRYEYYRRRKRIAVSSIALLVLLAIMSSFAYGYYSETKRAEYEQIAKETERKRADTAEALAMFERKTFPYSLVVGYVDNFLKPLISNLEQSQADYDIYVFMPYCYNDLETKVRVLSYKEQMAERWGSDSIVIAEFEVPNRPRGISIGKLWLNNSDKTILLDNANTVIAFKAVIDYKINSTNNPLPIPNTIENKDSLVREYTDEFIECVYSSYSLKDYDISKIHFIRNANDFVK